MHHCNFETGGSARDRVARVQRAERGRWTAARIADLTLMNRVLPQQREWRFGGR